MPNIIINIVDVCAHHCLYTKLYIHSCASTQKPHVCQSANSSRGFFSARVNNEVHDAKAAQRGISIIMLWKITGSFALGSSEWPGVLTSSSSVHAIRILKSHFALISPTLRKRVLKNVENYAFFARLTRILLYCLPEGVSIIKQC